MELHGLVETCNLVCLGTFRAFNDVKLDFVTLLQGLVSIELDGTVVNEDVCSFFSA